MAEIQIQDEHKPAIARAQHVLEWLQGEQQRLQGELAHVVQAGQREQEKLANFLRAAYHIELTPGTQVDADSTPGTITTPEPVAPETAESAPPSVEPIFLNRAE